MPIKDLNKFFLSIVLPSILAIVMFILSIFVVILPSFERSIMKEKKQSISELTNAAWSLLDEYYQEQKDSILTQNEAKALAASRIEKIRYGGENKDYFWITDNSPVMIMHPYRPELINKDLSHYIDARGKKLFVEATKIVSEYNEGFINYMWQWKDDSTRIVPKLSYVKGFEPWGWIIGTGIYLEDVKSEIRSLKSRLLWISFVITLVIITILLFVIRQSLNIENKRKDAESKLLLSRQKYKSLVEAATEGTLMILNGKIVFSNVKFSKLTGYDINIIPRLKLEDIFKIDWKETIEKINDPSKSISIETELNCNNCIRKEVVLSISEIKYGNDNGYIIITKEVTQKEIIKQETEHLTQELQTSLLLMNQPIKPFINDLLKCSIDLSIQDAVLLMTRKKRNALFIHKEGDVIGIVNNSDIKKRVVAANLDTKKPVSTIMSSPIMSINEGDLLYEAILKFRKNKISHLAVKNENGDIHGVICCEDITNMQLNTLTYIIREIEQAEDVDQLHKIHQKVPVLVNALVESGDKTNNITRIITSVSDSITNRIITLAVEELGPPPCEFAFMVMGSEGRMEQTLSTDQDNAIVYENLDDSEITEKNQYFLRLAEHVNHNLNLVGYRLCKGEVMAKNPKWTQPLSKWKSYFTDWINNGDPLSIMEASIFFDFRCVYGEESLINELRTHVNESIQNKSVFFYHLAQSILKYKPPLSLFGNIVSDASPDKKTILDIKKILLPIIGFIRLYALHNTFEVTNSIARLKQLHNKNKIAQALYDELLLSYNYLMNLRFRFQAKQILQNLPPDNVIDINELTQIEIATLKKILNEVSNLQTKLSFDFKGSM